MMLLKQFMYIVQTLLWGMSSTSNVQNAVVSAALLMIFIIHFIVSFPLLYIVSFPEILYFPPYSPAIFIMFFPSFFPCFVADWNWWPLVPPGTVNSLVFQMAATKRKV